MKILSQIRAYLAQRRASPAQIRETWLRYVHLQLRYVRIWLREVHLQLKYARLWLKYVRLQRKYVKLGSETCVPDPETCVSGREFLLNHPPGGRARSGGLRSAMPMASQ